MRTAEWEFAELWHPIYERPEGEQRWPVPLPGLVPAPYQPTLGQRAETEPLHMDVEGFPSADVYQAPGGDTIQKVDLRTQYMEDIDTREVEELAREWAELMQQMSLGPYSLEDLAEMGYPYGYGEPGEPPSWERLSRPRAIPRIAMRVPIRGIRQSVPDHTVINLQEGGLLQNWYFRVLRWYGGLTLLFGNRKFYSWFLAHGTYKMQAHGPWAFVAQRLLPKLHKLWRAAAFRAWRRQMERSQGQQAAMLGQFGEAALQRNEQYEAGGFR